MKTHQTQSIDGSTDGSAPAYPMREWINQIRTDFNDGSSFEGKAWAGRRDEGVIKGHWIVTRKSMGRTHPNEKPVSLMGAIIDKLPPGCTVLDPFMGSGTTGLACIRTGRRFVGIEKDPAHYATALERIQRELSQGDLFLDSPNKQI